MQRFSILAVIVATNLACGTFLAHADNDTPAQAAARAALEQQMTQMDNGQLPGSTNSMTPPTEPSAPPATPSGAPAAQPAQPALPPIATPTPQFSTNIPMNVESETPPAGMSTNEAATPQVGSQTNAGAMTVPPAVLNTHETEQYPVNPPMAPLPSQVENPSTPQPVATEPAQPTTPMPVPPATAQSNPNAQQLPPAVATGPGPAANPAPGSGLANEPQNSTNSVPNFESITAPPLPINQQQQAELQSLLSQYMANQITPAQYREQREKIIAGQQ